MEGDISDSGFGVSDGVGGLGNRRLDSGDETE